jgi:DNA-binding IclR family transcriptional regulator
MGLLRKDDQTKGYTLSPKVLEFASAFLKSNPLVERAYPYLLEASRRTEEAVNLVLREQDAVIFAARIPGRQPFALDIVIGDWYPAWAIADGRAILAALPEPEARAIVAASERRAYTDETVTDLEALMAELGAARKLGYAYAANQYVPETMSIGAPVLGFGGRAEAAVTIHGPTSRVSEKAARRDLAPIVIETARAISTVLVGRSGLPPLPRPQRP